jgi:uncharacterized protein
MKYNLLVTQACNLRCCYCYIGKKTAVMTRTIAEKAVDFIFKRTPDDEKIHIGFFGGEPLLEFNRIKQTVRYIEAHPLFNPDRVELAVVTNGTIFSKDIAHFISKHHISFGISCDGPPKLHDRFRCRADGGGSSEMVERTISQALDAFDRVLVNAVYRPETLRFLSETVDYLAGLGLRHIYLNADYSAPWAKANLDALLVHYDAVADRHIQFYLEEDPRFISLIDSKIAVILRNGYAPMERCRMGKGEMAFTPDGAIYPCERLVGAGDGRHRIGHVDTGIDHENGACRLLPTASVNPSCQSCGIRDYCMNWCGCSNYFATGYYNRVSPFICASEKAAIGAATRVIEALEQTFSDIFCDHLAGHTQVNAGRD